MIRPRNERNINVQYITEVSATRQAPHANQHLSRKGISLTPYDPLGEKCPKCRAYEGKPCVSSKSKKLRYPHVERVEASASEYRSAYRLKILGRIRRLVPMGEEFGSRRLGGREFAARSGGEYARI
jgi:hypothetical protein